MHSVHSLWMFLVLVGVCGFSNGHTKDDTDTTPALKPEEMFQDLFPLTSENFTISVLRTKDPWIVIFHDGSVQRPWKTMAMQVRGMAWVGLVDVTQEKELLFTLVSMELFLCTS